MSTVASSNEPPRRFLHTRWSVVLAATGKDSVESALALEAFCRSYWQPLYAYVRRCGHSRHDAQDLTQEFFGRLLEKRWLDSAAREKGKLRTFLIVALKKFMSNESRRASAQEAARFGLPAVRERRGPRCFTCRRLKFAAQVISRRSLTPCAMRTASPGFPSEYVKPSTQIPSPFRLRSRSRRVSSNDHANESKKTQGLHRRPRPLRSRPCSQHFASARHLDSGRTDRGSGCG